MIKGLEDEEISTSQLTTDTGLTAWPPTSQAYHIPSLEEIHPSYLLRDWTYKVDTMEVELKDDPSFGKVLAGSSTLGCTRGELHARYASYQV
jgi:hypothetical protein